MPYVQQLRSRLVACLMTWREHARMQLGQLPPLMPPAIAAGEHLSFCPTSPRLLHPNNRLKFLCSYGGKIVPRPSDGHLKYVGGHTRVLAVPRSISFSELKERVEGLINGRVAAIKYELEAEGIDTLVSITCDDDLAHMLEVYDRLEASHASSASAAASPRFRLFLFTSPSSASSSAGTSPSSTIDAPASFRLSALVGSTPDLAGGGSGQQPHPTPENAFLRRQRSSGSTAHCGSGGGRCQQHNASPAAAAVAPATQADRAQAATRRGGARRNIPALVNLSCGGGSPNLQEAGQ